MERMVFTDGATGDIQVQADSANSTHRLTPDGDGWDAVAVFVKKWNPAHSTPLHIPEPVRVTKENGVEEMRYNSSAMETGRIYQVLWNGKMYGLRKTESEVEIMRFCPDEHGHGD